jgi:hypothetical protein
VGTLATAAESTKANATRKILAMRRASCDGVGEKVHADAYGKVEEALGTRRKEDVGNESQSDY